TYSVEQGLRYTWTAFAGQARALESPNESERRATAWYQDFTQARIRLNFSSAYSGTIHLYAVDFGSTIRRQNVTVDDGSGPRTVKLAVPFDNGAWIHFPIAVPAGGSVVIKIDLT